jgi:hypothetical protein
MFLIAAANRCTADEAGKPQLTRLDEDIELKYLG